MDSPERTPPPENLSPPPMMERAPKDATGNDNGLLCGPSGREHKVVPIQSRAEKNWNLASNIFGVAASVALLGAAVLGGAAVATSFVFPPVTIILGGAAILSAGAGGLLLVASLVSDVAAKHFGNDVSQNMLAFSKKTLQRNAIKDHIDKANNTTVSVGNFTGRGPDTLSDGDTTVEVPRQYTREYAVGKCTVVRANGKQESFPVNPTMEMLGVRNIRPVAEALEGDYEAAKRLMIFANIDTLANAQTMQTNGFMPSGASDIPSGHVGHRTCVRIEGDRAQILMFTPGELRRNDDPSSLTKTWDVVEIKVSVGELKSGNIGNVEQKFMRFRRSYDVQNELIPTERLGGFLQDVPSLRYYAEAPTKETQKPKKGAKPDDEDKGHPLFSSSAP